MRLKSSIWVAAYLRRCQGEGIFGAVRRRGAEEAGAVFVKIALLDGNAMLYAPAPQTAYDESRPSERVFAPMAPRRAARRGASRPEPNGRAGARHRKGRDDTWRGLPPWSSRARRRS